MPVSPDLLDVVGDFYAAATEPSMWEVAVRRLGESLGCVAAHLFLSNHAQVTASTKVALNLSEEALREYETDYIKVCPRCRAYRERPWVKVLYDYQHTPEDEMRRDPFYSWMYRNSGMKYYVGAVVDVEEHTSLMMALHRTPEQGHVQQREIELFSKVLPHIERAIQIRHRLCYLDARLQAAQAALDQLSCGVFILDRSGVVAAKNRAAERLLDARDGLRIDKGILKASHRDDNQFLQSTVRAAVMTSLQRGAEAGGAVAVRRLSAKRSYSLLVAPIPRREMLFVVDHPAAVVFAMDPAHTKQLPADLLRRHFALTGAEANVAIRLCTGMTLEDVAEALNITVATARTHLKRIFSKTDTRRQAELVRIVMQTVGELDGLSDKGLPGSRQI